MTEAVQPNRSLTSGTFPLPDRLPEETRFPASGLGMRLLSQLVRMRVRRQSWGRTEWDVARRARAVFGTPTPLRALYSRGVDIESVRDGEVRGEWIVPRDAEPGVILYIHGGGFLGGSPGTHRPITTGLARRTQRRVFAVDYRLAPEHRFPNGLNDCLAAYQWLVQHSPKRNRIAIAGDSAGGNLTLATMLRARGERTPMPACACVFSPWTDLAEYGEWARQAEPLDAMFHPDNGDQFARAYLGQASPRNPLASPVYADLRGLPPLLLQVSSSELLLEDSRRAHAHAQAAGVKSQLEVYEGPFHVWHMLDGLLPEAGLALSRAAEFLLSHLR